MDHQIQNIMASMSSCYVARILECENIPDRRIPEAYWYIFLVKLTAYHSQNRSMSSLRKSGINRAVKFIYG